ncbi:ThuA domain-containing protein [Cryptosporangium arvum]|uniref:Trehalose utilization ThuA family protein n=1 Tax=Cryptosporangium arvum DSM 44712 TaxID=927661 RepID=A0A010YQ46_9ACTN|nr:ThuA domain-containing protein [Cryptosporangium arvum]EXG82300.1 trehalose utilization ThuA family protein [Cryptosporangium arvum DSM 44712]
MDLRRLSLFAVLAAALAVLATGLPGAARTVQAPPSAGGAKELGDPDYGVCRGTDARCYHDWGNFDPAKGYRVLLYTRTAGPRHANLGPALGAGLNPTLTAANVVQNGVVALGEKNGFTVDWTEDVTRLATPSALFKYNAVIFFSTSRDTLDGAAQTALRQYVRGGGGFVGVHNAFGTEYNWPWYEGLLGNANFYDHGPAQPGVVQTVGRSTGLPARWNFTDEWYNLVPAPTKVRVLATVDEPTLKQGVRGSQGHPGHGRNHPVAWCQYYDGGRAWLTTLGHGADIFGTGAEAQNFQTLLSGGIESAMGEKPFCQ